MARFTDAHTHRDRGGEGNSSTITADTILIACGTRPAENPLIVTDGQRVFNSDQLLHLPLIPRDLIVVGGGVIGLEYAAMMTALGTRSRSSTRGRRCSTSSDHEIIESLCHHLRAAGATFRLGEKVASRERRGWRARRRASRERQDGQGRRAAVRRGSAGEQRPASTRRRGLAADERGRIKVNEYFQTVVPHIYAAGDVIGFPALAATSMEQGRLASFHMFGFPMQGIATPAPVRHLHDSRDLDGRDAPNTS